MLFFKRKILYFFSINFNMNNSTYNTEDYYMRIAFDLAKKALDLNEVPVGAIIVLDGKIISQGYNRKESDNCVIAHAEMIAIQQASKYLNNWRLNRCEMYVTLEPCPMCTGAIIQSRISKITYGSKNPNYGSLESVLNLQNYYPDAKNISLKSGIMNDEISEMLKNFFRKKL